MTSPQKLLYIFDASPYSTAKGVEALDALMIGATFEQDISVLFVFNGVFQLKSGQDLVGLKIKQYTRAFNALIDFEVSKVYVHDQSLIARGLTGDSLMIDCDVINSTQVAALVAEQHRVFTF